MFLLDLSGDAYASLLNLEFVIRVLDQDLFFLKAEFFVLDEIKLLKNQQGRKYERCRNWKLKYHQSASEPSTFPTYGGRFSF